MSGGKEGLRYHRYEFQPLSLPPLARCLVRAREIKRIKEAPVGIMAQIIETEGENHD